MVMLHSDNKVDKPANQHSLINITGIRYLDNSVILSSQLPASIMNNVAKNTLVNVYVDLVVFTRIAGTSQTGSGRYWC